MALRAVHARQEYVFPFCRWWFCAFGYPVAGNSTLLLQSVSHACGMQHDIVKKEQCGKHHTPSWKSCMLHDILYVEDARVRIVMRVLVCTAHGRALPVCSFVGDVVY